jgi:hypothetical protein
MPSVKEISGPVHYTVLRVLTFGSVIQYRYVYGSVPYVTVFRISKFFGLPYPDPLVRGTDPKIRVHTKYHGSCIVICALIRTRSFSIDEKHLQFCYNISLKRC